MTARKVKVASSVGLHARPATLFVQAVQDTGLEVTISKEGGKPVMADSILLVMSLGVYHGDEVVLEAEGEGSEEALDRLVDLLSRDLDDEAQAKMKLDRSEER